MNMGMGLTWLVASMTLVSGGGWCVEAEIRNSKEGLLMQFERIKEGHE